METAPEPASLFAKLGGAPMIEAVVEGFCGRVFADPILAPFFAGTDLAWQKRRQVQFFTQIMGGPKIYKGKGMREAHKKMHIEARHFHCMVGHLIETLKSLGVAQADITLIVALVAPLEADIVNTKIRGRDQTACS